MKRTLRLAFAFLIFSSAQWVHAAAISGVMHEPFSYAPARYFRMGPQLGRPMPAAGWNLTGDQSIPNTAAWGTGNQNNGAAAGTNRTAAAPGLTLTYNAGGLPTGYYPPSGNRLFLYSLTPASSESNSRNLGGQTVDAGTMYFSLIVRRENDTVRSMNFAFFSLIGTTSSERFGVGQIGATVSGSLQGSNGKIAGIYQNGNPANIRASTVDMGTGVSHLILGRFDFNAGTAFDTVTLWVDPLDVTTEATALPAQFYTGTEFDLDRINYVRPFTGNQAAGPPIAIAVQGSYDELRFGGTWESVTSQATVPEPASFALVALAGLALGAFRKRESALAKSLDLPNRSGDPKIS